MVVALKLVDHRHGLPMFIGPKMFGRIYQERREPPVLIDHEGLISPRSSRRLAESAGRQSVRWRKMISAGWGRPSDDG